MVLDDLPSLPNVNGSGALRSAILRAVTSAEIVADTQADGKSTAAAELKALFDALSTHLAPIARTP